MFCDYKNMNFIKYSYELFLKILGVMDDIY